MLTLKKYRQNITVDFGSYYTKIFVGEKLVFKERTVALASKREVACVSFGNEAIKKSNKPISQESFTLTYPVKDGYISNSTTSHAFLKHFLDQLKGRIDILKPDFTLKVPYGLNSIQEYALIKVFTEYGANIIKLQNTYKYLKNKFENINNKLSMIISLGGGINEFFLIKNNEVEKYESSSYAGIELTKKIGGYLEAKFAVGFSFQEVESLKINLASAKQEEEIGYYQITSISGKKFQIESKDIQSCVNKYLGEIVTKCENLLNGLDQKDLELIRREGILLFGGASHLKNIREFLSRVLGIVVY